MQVSEIFKSVQGEGRHLGCPAIFIRLAGCNLRCDFCDTKFSWDKGTFWTTDDLVNEIGRLNCPHIVITGGEPLLQQSEIMILLGRLPYHYIEIETNGTLSPNPILLRAVDCWNVSIKHTGVYKGALIGKWNWDIGWAVPIRAMETVWLKFVVNELRDFDQIDELIEGMDFPKDKVMVMPMCIDIGTHNQKLEWMIPEAVKRGYRVSPRLQIVVWGNKRGV